MRGIERGSTSSARVWGKGTEEASEGTVPPDPHIILEESFGHREFLPGQLEVIESLLDGHSAAAVFPTGGGKSLCYQLPALLLDGLTLVVSPLIALMKDQIDALAARGIAAARLDSTLSYEENREVTRSIRGGRLRLLYVAPERFSNERFREAIRPARIACFAVDEAHCISEWGHNFRPEYLKLARFARECAAERLLALTATATPEVLDDICRLFEIEPARAVRTTFYRSNLRLSTTPITSDRRDAHLLARLGEHPAASTIVYVMLQKTAERLAETLARNGFPARAYHAGLRDDVRAEVQDWFMGSDRAVVVATIAFGMGIDKPDIRAIYHYNLPKSLENYAQEIGRAGRDGEPSVCEMLVSREDLNVLENFVYGDTPTRSSTRALVDQVLAGGERFDVSHNELSYGCDLRISVVRTLLAYLELDGFIEGGTPFYAGYQFKPLVPIGEIVGRFDGERREFLANVLGLATKAKLWFTIDVTEAASLLNSPRERILRALDYLAEQELLELKVSEVRHRYRRLRFPDDPTALADTLFERMVDRERREVDRLQQVLDWASHDGCQSAALARRFGETLDRDCGHCSWCQSGSAIHFPEAPRREIDKRTWRDAERVRAAHPEALREARAFARWLCGVTSPGLIRARLTRDPVFGALADVPFARVLERAEAGG